MKKIIKGNIKFTKPVIEKLLDIHYIVEKDKRDIIKHKFIILTYEEFDRDITSLLDGLGEDIKLAVVEQAVLVNFGDEEIHRSIETEIFYDEKWISKHNPDYNNLEEWIFRFIDNAIFEGKRCKE